MNYPQAILAAMEQRVAAALMEAEAAHLKEVANAVLMEALTQSDAGRLEHPEYGSFSLIAPAVMHTLDKDKLKEYLATEGVSVTIITSCFAKCTKIGIKTSYVKFIPKKSTVKTTPWSQSEKQECGVYTKPPI